MNRDYKEESVTQYKNLMGINTGVTTVVIGELFNGHHLGVSGILAQLKANWFVLSFENSGIILIGMDRFGHYKEQNAFLPTKKIISAKMHRRLGKKILTIMISNGKKFILILIPRW